jgi:outer membrane translocation and assembly module TamA
MSKTETQEKLVEIANRIPPGDNWKVSNVNEIQKSLTDALEAWFQMATIKPNAFRLDLAAGKIYAILNQEVEIKEPEPKRYNIYGDY